ncbi:MAG TPA: response regulator [Thermoanaerobaculia bacterium]|nr:response regulator [Thermoanaerobaculia bacterium]
MNDPLTTARERIVLLLDDNPLVLKLARALLEREGIQVVSTSNWGEFGQAMIATPPDMILMDVNMPSISGNRLTEILKTNPKKALIPVVLMSDMPEETLAQIAQKAGADAWVRKPLTREKLALVLDRLLRKKV